MKKFTCLLALLVAGGITTRAAELSTNAALTDRMLLIDSSSTPITAGKVTLTIGSLRRADGVYSGEYKLKVFPYFYKNERGRLAIAVSDEALAEIRRGKVATLHGTATTSGKNGKCRQIEATVTPTDPNHGTLKICFIAGTRKMIFQPVYHLAETGKTAVLAETNETKP